MPTSTASVAGSPSKPVSVSNGAATPHAAASPAAVNSILNPSDTFAHRHIGPDDKDIMHVAAGCQDRRVMANRRRGWGQFADRDRVFLNQWRRAAPKIRNMTVQNNPWLRWSWSTNQPLLQIPWKVSLTPIHATRT